MLGAAARKVRLPFDSIALILVFSNRAAYCVAQREK
jgi:hypothetical protein